MRTSRSFKLYVLGAAALGLGGLLVAPSCELHGPGHSPDASNPLSGGAGRTIPDERPSSTWDFARFGAQLPFVTLEAEDTHLNTNGIRIVRVASPQPNEQTPALEASGRGYVELTSADDYLEWSATKPGNALLLRFSVPDAPEGGGRATTIAFSVEGDPAQILTLHSRRAFLYSDDPSEPNGQSNQPGGDAHVFWDEERWLLPAGWSQGDILRISPRTSQSQGAVRIDLIETEQVGPPLSPPDGALAVTECGALPDDDVVDTLAIQECLERARHEQRVAWFPAGRFLHDARLDLDGLTVGGAGMWHTVLAAADAPPAQIFGGSMGFRLSGRGSTVRDLTLESGDTNRRDGSIAFLGSGSQWTVERVWMRWLTGGLWAGGEGGRVVSSRVRMTYADGLNVNNGNDHRAEGIVLENNHVRGTGDDGIAILSHQTSPYRTQGIVVRNNTVVAPWWGHNLDIAGGDGHVINGNLLADSALSAALTINLPPSYPMHDQGPVAINNNAILRGGGNLSGQERGAIWIYAGSAEVDAASVENNWIVAPWFSALDVRGPRGVFLRFFGNRIEQLDGPVLTVQGVTPCQLLLEKNVVDHAPADSSPAAREWSSAEVRSACQVQERANSW